jgi:hypothetical protein
MVSRRFKTRAVAQTERGGTGTDFAMICCTESPQRPRHFGQALQRVTLRASSCAILLIELREVVFGRSSSSFSSPSARAWDGHEIVALAVGGMALLYAEEDTDEVVAVPEDKTEAVGIRKLDAPAQGGAPFAAPGLMVRKSSNRCKRAK